MKTKIASLTLLLFLFGFLSVFAQTKADPVIENVGPQKFQELLNKKDGMLIDLRTPAEIEKGFIKGSVMIDYTDKNYEQEFAKLDKSKTMYVYCAGGGRSSSAADYMKEHGFKKVVNLEKGFKDWKKQGLPVELKK